MSLILADGFEIYGVTNSSPSTSFGRRYTNASGTMSVIDGRFAGNALQLSGVGNNAFDYANLGNQAQFVVGFAAKLPTNSHFMYTFDGATMGPNLATNGSEIDFRVGGTVVDTTSGLTIDDGNWHYIELLCVISTGFGLYSLQVDGTGTIFGVTNTQAGADAFVDRVRFGSTNETGISMTIDDMYIADGNLPPDLPQADQQQMVETLFPSNDFAVSWNTSAGSDHFALVNENPTDDDSTYVEIDAAGQDLFQFPTLSTIGGTIYSANLTAEFESPDNLSNTIGLMSNQAGSISEVNTSVTNTYGMAQATFEHDPDTSANWASASDLANCAFGVEHL